MEAGRARYRDDKLRAPTLSVGLSSVRLIVNQIEAEYARAVAAETFGNGHELVKYDPIIDESCSDYEDFPLGRPRGRVWRRIAVNLGVALSRCIPSVTFGNFGVLAVLIGTLAPRMISYLVVYPFCRLVFGTLYPAYASYKAVRTKNLKEYVKWMMYWIVFALFTCTETFTDVFLSWFPFYYEVKIVLVLWLLSPATKGSSILYRKFVHPALCRREQEIDEYIAKAKDQGYHTVLNLGTKGVNYATTVIMQTAIKGGGGLVQQLRKSYSLSDLSECEPREEHAGDEADDVLSEPRLIKRGGKSGYSTRRSASESNSRSPMYFPEVDVEVRSTRASRSDEPDFSHIKSSDDISSGYSSADNSTSLKRTASLLAVIRSRAHIKSSDDISSGYSSADNSASLTRTASLGAAARARARASRTTVTTIKRPHAAEESEVIIEELLDDDTFDYANMPPLVNVPSPIFLSHSDPPFIYQYVGDQVKILQVLGNYPFDTKIRNEMKDTMSLDETKTLQGLTEKKPENNEEANKSEPVENVHLTKHDIAQKNDVRENTDNNLINPDITVKSSENDPQRIDVQTFETKVETVLNEVQQKTVNFTDVDTISLETTNNETYSAESDDEASFGTPEDSPKAKRKSPKGKYGKAKAPPPPKLDIPKDVKQGGVKFESNVNTSQESLNDIINQMPNIIESNIKGGLQVINPIAEKKRRHKSKSPGRIPKSPSSGLGKLLQIPNKLVFWHKSDDKNKLDNLKSDTVSSSSEDRSRRSSTVEKQVDEFQSCLDLNAVADINSEVDNYLLEDELDNDQSGFKDATDFDNEISNDIIEKSDALQKLIEAKIESHPEYKYVSLHEEIPTTSKSTDV